MANYWFHDFYPGYSAVISTHGWFYITKGPHVSWPRESSEPLNLIYDDSVFELGALYGANGVELAEVYESLDETKQRIVDRLGDNIWPDTEKELLALLRTWAEQHLEGTKAAQ